MKNINNGDNIDKSDADIFNKMYANTNGSQSSPKTPYKPLSNNTNNQQIQKTEADIFNNLYKGVKTKTNSYSSNVKTKFKEIFQKKNKKIIVISGSAIVGIVIFLIFIQGFIFKGVTYTKNPSLSNLPINSVVKIIVDKGTDNEASGSGLLFTKDGYILTNAHVITTPLGKDVKNIQVCYTTANNQEIKCDYDAKIIDADRSEDLAVIKVDGGIKEIKPYPLVVQQDDESWTKEIYSLGSAITVIGFPGLGGKSITITKGTVSGYKNGEIVYDDGSLNKIPYFIKTDAEINFGNSGGAVLDKDNRYIGIPSLINYDGSGKIGRVIYWNKINLYLNQLVYADKISLPSSQYIKRGFSFTESDLWNGVKSYFKEDYKTSITYLERYLNAHSNDSRALNYLCSSYILNGEINKLEGCAEKLRVANPKATALSWFFSSIYNKNKEKDYNKAYASINIALNLEQDSILLLGMKAELEYYLDKNEDLLKTFKKMWEVDEEDSDTLYYGGLLAIQQNDTETAITFLEASFKTKPSSFTAGFLADLYDAKYEKSQDGTNLGIALYYRTAGLVLDSSNISNVVSLTNSLLVVFNSVSQKSDTWGDSIESIKEFLVSLELDKSLINPINQVSDTDIRNYFINNGVKEVDITQTDIDAVRYYIKMNIAWLYTLIDDKISCLSQFGSFNSSNITKVLMDVGFTKKESTVIVNWNVLLECACNSNSFSNEEMNTCYDKGLNKLY